MRRPRFTIAGLLGLVLGLAVGLAALRQASDVWDGLVFGGTLAVLLASVLLAVHRDGSRRSFWLGFALFGWVYLGASLIPPIEARLATTRALIFLDSKVLDRVAPSVKSPSVYSVSSSVTTSPASPGGQVTLGPATAVAVFGNILRPDRGLAETDVAVFPEYRPFAAGGRLRDPRGTPFAMAPGFEAGRSHRRILIGGRTDARAARWQGGADHRGGLGDWPGDGRTVRGRGGLRRHGRQKQSRGHGRGGQARRPRGRAGRGRDERRGLQAGGRLDDVVVWRARHPLRQRRDRLQRDDRGRLR